MLPWTPPVWADNTFLFFKYIRPSSIIEPKVVTVFDASVSPTTLVIVPEPAIVSVIKSLPSPELNPAILVALVLIVFLALLVKSKSLDDTEDVEFVDDTDCNSYPWALKTALLNKVLSTKKSLLIFSSVNKGVPSTGFIRTSCKSIPNPSAKLGLMPYSTSVGRLPSV